MEQKEEKQNLEEEELEEDEEEKEVDKEEVENKKEEKDENDKKQDEELKKEDQQNDKSNEEKKEITEKVEKNEENNKIVEKKEESNIKEEKESQQKIEDINDKENKNISELKNENEENQKGEEIKEEEKEEEIKESATTYILKYSRKNNEPRESSYDKQLIKSKHCLFMIDSKIIKKKNEKYLLLYCHEIAAIYFDEIYEKKFSLQDLYKENRHFRIFDDIEEAKSVIDEILNTNSSNSKKIFIDLQDNIFRLHLNIVFFDKECEVIFNVPKKHIDDEERIRILPDFLKEIQIKMNHLEEENKKIKNENRNIAENELIEGDNDFFGEKNETNPNIKKSKSGTSKGYKKKLIKK